MLQNWDVATVYLPDETGQYKPLLSGTTITRKHKAYDDLYNLFTLPFGAGDSATVYVQARSRNPALSLPVKTDFILVQLDELAWQHQKQQKRSYLIFQVFLLAQVVSGLLLFLASRQRIILYYVLTILGCWLYDVSFVPQKTLLGAFPALYPLNDMLMIVATALVAYGTLNFERLYLYLDRYLPKSGRYILVICLTGLLIRFLGTVLDYNPGAFGISSELSAGFSRGIFIVWAFVLAITFLLIVLIPLWGIVKQLNGAWLLLIAVFLPATGTAMSSVLQPVWLILHPEASPYYDLIGHCKAGIGPASPLNMASSSYALMQGGEAFFVITIAVMIGLRARRLIREREAALQTQVENEKRLSKQLRELDALKDQFLANTSHELRTPLQGIIGLAESLRTNYPQKNLREHLDMIIASGKRLSFLVNDILDFSRLKHHDINLRPKAVDPRTLAEVVLRNLHPLVAGKTIQLVNDIPQDCPAVMADEDRLQQVLFNLAGNSIKFTESGELRLGVSHIADDELTLFVSDTGIGIPEDKQAAIFREFEQVENADTRSHGGTGLGLPIARRLIELQGGKLWVNSAENQGATFYFTLPRAKDAATPLSTQENATIMRPVQSEELLPEEDAGFDATESPAAEPLQILVVDDEPVNQMVLKGHLSHGPYHITQAMNGAEALRLIDSGQRFDLVLLDIMMPRMSGYEVCQKIREKYLPSELPVIMVTAKNQVNDLVEGLSSGANDYISKPFTRDEFLARVRTQLDLYRIYSVTRKFVPNEFIRALGRERITDVQLGDHTERRLTVFFSDIRGYTSMAETMSPDDNFRFVVSYNGRMGPVIRKHRGFVSQYLGDGIMAIFPHSPEDALRAAVDMQETLRSYNAQRIAQSYPPMRVGMGMHTGNLIMGIIGDEQRLDPASVSDTVNTAARVESLSAYFKANILLSENSREELINPGDFHLRYLGLVQVKGRKEPLGIYECIDGDAPDLFAQKAKAMPQFAEALAHYYAKNFEAAVQLFGHILQQCPDDGASAIFYEAAQELCKQGAPEGWTGVIHMTAK